MHRIPTVFSFACLLSAIAIAVAVPTMPLTATAADTLVNINTASAEELQTLPGIGPAIAQRVIEFRESNGPFKGIAELLNVRGIGEKTYEELKDRITVSSEKRK